MNKNYKKICAMFLIAAMVICLSPVAQINAETSSIELFDAGISTKGVGIGKVVTPINIVSATSNTPLVYFAGDRTIPAGAAISRIVIKGNVSLKGQAVFFVRRATESEFLGRWLNQNANYESSLTSWNNQSPVGVWCYYVQVLSGSNCTVRGSLEIEYVYMT